NITASQLVKGLQEGLNSSPLLANFLAIDFYFGDDHTIDPELVDLFLKQNIDGKINEEALSKLHWIRLNNSKEVNPTLLYNTRQKILSAGESSLLLNFIGANTNFEIDIEKLDVFLKHERFPEGWEKPNKTVGLCSIISGLRSFLKRYDQRVFN
ncbi:8939_t:CDS:2, partial [Racocetra fulgida]